MFFYYNDVYEIFCFKRPLPAPVTAKKFIIKTNNLKKIVRRTGLVCRCKKCEMTKWLLSLVLQFPLVYERHETISIVFKPNRWKKKQEIVPQAHWRVFVRSGICTFYRNFHSTSTYAPVPERIHKRELWITIYVNVYFNISKRYFSPPTNVGNFSVIIPIRFLRF